MSLLSLIFGSMSSLTIIGVIVILISLGMLFLLHIVEWGLIGIVAGLVMVFGPSTVVSLWQANDTNKLVGVVIALVLLIYILTRKK